MQNVIKCTRLIFNRVKYFVDNSRGSLAQKSVVLIASFCVIMLASMVIQYFILYQVSHLHGWNISRYILEYFTFFASFFLFFGKDLSGRYDAAILLMGFKLVWFSFITIPYIYTGKWGHLVIFLCGVFFFSLIFTVGAIGA